MITETTPQLEVFKFFPVVLKQIIPRSIPTLQDQRNFVDDIQVRRLSVI